MPSGYGSLYGGVGVQGAASGSSGPTSVITQLFVHQRLFDDAAGASPANNTINFTTDIDPTKIDNSFNNGALDGIAGDIFIPDNLDLTVPIDFEFWWKPSNNAAGDVDWDIYTSRFQLGDAANSSNPQLVSSIIQAVAAGQNQISRRWVFSIDVSAFAAGDILAIAVYRDARGSNVDDTYAGNAQQIAMRATGTILI